ncbi:hypothetical protein ZIOFF_053488 [Zingiber officinale]|uniref:STAR protein homodimerisation region domain-containing protein n=1 Tax=Zingiber officinale TaxID=94328 RepID=A0A8J5FGH6_ZINOF|nr:hypothetical protein ZIOFF_053488 [Zingiber officinale]
MSSLYAHSFFPTAPVSPQACSKEDIDSQYLAQLLSEHQSLGPFMQVFPICSHLLNKDHQCLHFTEILRVSGMVSSQGFENCSRIQQRSPSPMANSNSICNVGGTGIGILTAPLRETDNIMSI